MSSWLKKTFDKQLSDRLVACFGKDNRKDEDDPYKDADASKDFSWIMSKKKKLAFKFFTKQKTPEVVKPAASLEI